MKTLIEVLKLSSDFLQQKGISNPRRQAEDLISDALSLSRIELYTHFERPCTEDELSICRNRLARRAKGEPLQYIHGETEFFNCSIKVTPAVLIPRQETELLVEKIVKTLELEDLKGKVLWDICTGSGCIGIALKNRFPDLKVILSDISPEAIEVAKENQRNNEVAVECRLGDLFAPFVGEKADFIVANPPYIAEAEYAGLDIEVKNYEPKSALVSGPTGLEFYERFASELPQFLNPSAKAWFETGHAQGEALLALFSGKPWKSVRAEKDWAGYDRFFSLEIE
jgi:release factor glutamine methyltransferase